MTLNGDISIQKSRIHGTLVIDAGSHKVSFDQEVFMHPVRADYATLVVKGKLELTCSAANSLSESSIGVNFNPAGSPYAGVWDNDQGDTYPCEIQGLVMPRAM